LKHIRHWLSAKVLIIDGIVICHVTAVDKIISLIMD
jgi:hypothetical protein